MTSNRISNSLIASWEKIENSPSLRRIHSHPLKQDLPTWRSSTRKLMPPINKQRRLKPLWQTKKVKDGKYMRKNKMFKSNWTLLLRSISQIRLSTIIFLTDSNSLPKSMKKPKAESINYMIKWRKWLMLWLARLVIKPKGLKRLKWKARNSNLS